MRKFVLFVLCCVPAFGQFTNPIPTGKTGPVYQVFVDRNFAWLYTNKADVNHTHSGVYAPISHLHLIRDITGLQQVLDTIQSTQGPKGDKGDPGDPGQQGIQGIPGDPGQQGIQGMQGVPGAPGAAGATGATGPAGANAPTANAYISSLITGPDLTKTITGVTHRYATAGLLVAVYDNSTPRNAIEASVSVDPVTYDVVVSFATPQTNYYVVVNGAAGQQGPQGPPGPAGSFSYRISPGLGDGLNAMPVGIYLQTVPNPGTTWTTTAIYCWTDNAGTSTLDVKNAAGTSLFASGPITCNATLPGATATLGATFTIPTNDAYKVVFISDGATKQTTWTIVGTR